MQIQSTRSSLVRQTPVPGRKPAPSEEPADRFTPGELPLQAPGRRGRWLKSVAMLGMTLGSASAYGATPGAQQAAVVVQEKPDDAKTRAAVDSAAEAALAELNQDAMHELGPQCVKTDEACRASFEQLPEVARREYLQMPLNVKKMMGGKLNGKTTIIPLIMVINHRKSFIKGEALGRNVFDFVQKKTDAMAAKGQIKPEHAPRVRRFLDTCRQLTPRQREQFVDLINRDLQLAR